ncbi:MAG: FAD-dependent oxidoreductase [Pseudomonadota bacterium]
MLIKTRRSRPGGSAPVARRDFLKFIAALGPAMLSGCSSCVDAKTRSFGGKVIVIGAGAAGLSAAYFLAKAGVEVEVLEAASTHGGRIKTVRDFVDFPIPLGGEWLHTDADELIDVTGREEPNIETVGYGETERYGYWEEGEYAETEIDGSEDLKFVGRTWLDVFDEFLLPTVAGNIQFNQVVKHIDYSGAEVTVTTVKGKVFRADKVIVTAPLTQLRDVLTFAPSLPDNLQSALSDAYIWGGLKAFIQFSERFYPSLIEFDGRSGERGEQLYYDAAYGQDTSAHVLGLFSVGTSAEPYQAAHRDKQLIEFVLAELDPIFDGRPSKSYQQHIVQDWSAEPHIGMAYLASSADWRVPRQFAKPIDDRVYFAGDAYIDDWEGWSMVHLAARSARIAVDRILV